MFPRHATRTLRILPVGRLCDFDGPMDTKIHFPLCRERVIRRESFLAAARACRASPCQLGIPLAFDIRDHESQFVRPQAL
jgi:hypothetical protein